LVDKEPFTHCEFDREFKKWSIDLRRYETFCVKAWPDQLPTEVA